MSLLAAVGSNNPNEAFKSLIIIPITGQILHFYLGDPMSVYISQDGKVSNTIVLGNNIKNNENIHIIVKAGSWFSMISSGEYSLIGCTVAPGFNYSDFELAPKNWNPGD